MYFLVSFTSFGDKMYMRNRVCINMVSDSKMRTIH